MQVIQEIREIKCITNWFIVDMGYSNNRKSCGLLIASKDSKDNPDDISFGELKNKFEDFLKTCKNEKIGLVLESPLSMAFDKNNNPLGRKYIEKEGTVTRYWYYGAAATVTLGALEFLHQIINKESDNIYLFEGFVSFKDKSDNKGSHFEDAEFLYEAIHDNKSQLYVIERKDTKYKFIGDYLSLKINGIPPVIKVSKKNEKNERITEIYMIK